MEISPRGARKPSGLPSPVRKGHIYVCGCAAHVCNPQPGGPAPLVPSVLSDAKVLLKVARFAERADISKSQVYDLIREGTIMAVRLGGCLRVPATVLDQLVNKAGK